MTYTMHYDSPLGKILLAADEEGLTGVWLETQKHFAAKLPPEHEEGTTPVLGDACRWLDVYFSGREPDFTPKLHLIGSDFRQAVGGAVGHNPVSIIVPCHRVVGSDGSLTGYAGGIDKKMRLLTLENAEAANLYR